MMRHVTLAILLAVAGAGVSLAFLSGNSISGIVELHRRRTCTRSGSSSAKETRTSSG